MRMRFTTILLGVCMLGSGCSFVRCIQQNLVQEPKTAFDEAIMLKRHERLANMAWDEMVAQYGCEFSCDYKIGFIDGFVDYLTYGGTSMSGDGEVPIVPAVPPPSYRHSKAMSPEGLAAAEDWIKGFRHGSNTALASGLRKLAVVPVFDMPNPTAEVVPGRFQTMPGKAPSDDTAPPDSEALPPPRTVPPGEGEPKPPAPPAGPAVPPPGGPAVPPPAVPPG
jgi:hypothetical protein